MMARRLEIALLCLLVLAVAASAGVLALRGGRQVVLGQYTTTLRGRTESQRYNAERAARALDGRVIKPGDALSYNEIVGPWTADAGYKRAPVSYDGELLSAWGGGVCQTSTTLYNAALLAGLEIVERHRHAWPPKYIAPGRDAAAHLHAFKRNRPRAEPATALSGMLPGRLASAFGAELPKLPLSELPDRLLSELGGKLNRWRLTPSGTEGYAKAEVTLGGVSTAALSSTTMESKSVPGLYVIGEAVDVTGWLGGYNFQWAWSSGRAAGSAL